MQKIIPNLWFDNQSVEAAKWYTSIFPDSNVKSIAKITDTPSGDCDLVSFDIMGYPIMAISGGPQFTLNPSISFMVNFDPSQDPNAKKSLDAIWQQLADGGTALMPLQAYPFSKWYGWIQDKYGVSWQLILTDPEGEPRPPIMPAMLFVGEVCGKAEEASDFYMSVFKGGSRGTIARYGAGQAPDAEGSVMFTDFTLEHQWFIAMDSAQNHQFSFNEALSYMVMCEDQQEIDYYWQKLSAVPEVEQCGWLKDKFGVSWQIVPKSIDNMMKNGNQEQINRLTQALMPMKKLDFRALEQAFNGN